MGTYQGPSLCLGNQTDNARENGSGSGRFEAIVPVLFHETPKLGERQQDQQGSSGLRINRDGQG
jgi:hypothetical protein